MVGRLIFLVVGFVIALTASVQATPFWSDGFESYSVGHAINGLGTIWSEASTGSGYGGAHGTVSTAYIHEGTRSLCVDSHDVVGGYWDGSTWSDATATAPHGDLIEIGWWMYVNTASGSYIDPHWRVSVQGWNNSTVAHIGNHELGSMASVDYQTTSGWTESFYNVVTNQWAHVFLQVNFTANPDTYRFRVGDAVLWSDWYSLGTNETVFRSASFVGASVSAVSGNPGVEMYLDDMYASIVPEPATICLLGLGGLALLKKRRA